MIVNSRIIIFKIPVVNRGGATTGIFSYFYPCSRLSTFCGSMLAWDNIDVED
jgi:hypothetical protein